MKIDAGLCQLRPVEGDPEANAGTVKRLLEDGPHDVLILPESYITGYGAPPEPLMDRVEACIGELSDACRETGRAAAIGTPRAVDGTVRNSLAFLSPDGDTWYDKAHLAKFGVYAEDGFAPGSGPAVGRYRGVGFGMCVCYDIFFPEILHGCSLEGASVNICVAASAIPSKPFLDTVLPARALENVSYLAYVNNVGPVNGLEMHGCSRGLDPFGKTVSECGTSECVRSFMIDTEELEKARSIRRHLEDYRSDIDWNVGTY